MNRRRMNASVASGVVLVLAYSILVSGREECKQTMVGGEYGGKLAYARTGRECQLWKSQHPHAHRFKTADKFVDSSLEDAVNYCRNPSRDSKGPWCYTTDPDVRWEYCDVPLCRKCTLTPFGWEYQGDQSTTNTGKSCQRWDQQIPHKHTYISMMLYPDTSYREATNYCRNPSFYEGGTWCYTNNSNVRWESCDVPLCKHCKQTHTGREYRGDLSVTRTGRECQNWGLQAPQKHNFTCADNFPDESMAQVANHCRNPSGEPGGPWCYTTDTRVRWEYCDIPSCLQCKMTKEGKEYQGNMDVTNTGLKCQHWSSQEPHQHSHNFSFRDSTLEEAANYCRNPGVHDAEGPWCYTVDSQVRWQYCDIPRCELNLEWS